LLGSATHEDFSDRYSWVKEDFERTFYSKRSKIKVSLYEFIDECPVHDGVDTPGYQDILFRDVMGFFDERDRRIILALRQGRTQSEIAEQMGHSGRFRQQKDQTDREKDAAASAKGVTALKMRLVVSI
jgi:hypothetical protein